jgi:hypothetical protein
VRIHAPREHALELELLDAVGMAFDVSGDCLRRVLVVLEFDQVQQLVRRGQPLAQAADAGDGLVEQRAFAAEGLCALRIVPDVRTFELAVDFLEALDLAVVVKDTPSAPPAGREGRRCAGGRD